MVAKWRSTFCCPPCHGFRITEWQTWLVRIIKTSSVPDNLGFESHLGIMYGYLVLVCFTVSWSQFHFTWSIDPIIHPVVCLISHYNGGRGAELFCGWATSNIPCPSHQPLSKNPYLKKKEVRKHKHKETLWRPRTSIGCRFSVIRQWSDNMSFLFYYRENRNKYGTNMLAIWSFSATRSKLWWRWYTDTMIDIFEHFLGHSAV
jgi:hypothetical protein